MASIEYANPESLPMNDPLAALRLAAVLATAAVFLAGAMGLRGPAATPCAKPVAMAAR